MIILNNAREDIVNNLAIRIALKDINEKLIKEIREKTNQYNGKTNVKFYIYDEEEGITLEMFSRNTSVSVTNELIEYLNKKSEIEFKVS